VRNLTNLWSIVREFNVRELRDELDAPLRVIVVGTHESGAPEVASAVDREGANIAEHYDVSADAAIRDQIEAADLLMVVVNAAEQLRTAEREAFRIAGRKGVPTALIISSSAADALPSDVVGRDVPTDMIVEIQLEWLDEAQRRIDDVLLRRLSHRHLTLARHVPRLRETVVEQLIRESSMANAEFAVLSTLPAWLPLLGGLLGDTADMLVLTKNQVLLVLKLAGIYGHDLDNWQRLIAEIAPVVGVGFAWRTIARSLVGFFPTPLSAVPKGAIAYVGTATIGEVARPYFRDGVVVDGTTLRQIRERVIARFRAGDAGASDTPAA